VRLHGFLFDLAEYLHSITLGWLQSEKKRDFFRENSNILRKKDKIDQNSLINNENSGKSA
jgi:hypothetical protein